MTARSLDDGYDACAGCGRLSIQKRVVISEPLVVRAICVSPWCARVVTRSRVCASVAGGDGTIEIREFATVCSVACLASMLVDPAWAFVKPWPEELRKATLFIGDDKLALKYGSRGVIPLKPQVGWVTFDDRRPVTVVEGLR